MTTEQDPQAAWDSIVEGFDELVTPINHNSGERALATVELGPGTRFLDVAAGSGALSLPAACGGAEVLATDLSPRMVERLRARARTAGLSNVEAPVMDGLALEFEDDATPRPRHTPGPTHGPGEPGPLRGGDDVTRIETKVRSIGQARRGRTDMDPNDGTTRLNERHENAHPIPPEAA